METDALECYYCPQVTDNLQTCITHAVEAYGGNIKGEGCFIF